MCGNDYISEKLSHKQQSGNSYPLHECPPKVDQPRGKKNAIGYKENNIISIIHNTVSIL